MRYINLNKGARAVVDDKDYDALSKFTWFLSDTGYAVSTRWKDNKAHRVRMHREVYGKTKAKYMDHINGNKLDNRRENLRECSNSENMRNRPAPSNNTSGYKGVFFCKQKGKYVAKIKLNYKENHLGTFSSKEEAAVAYNEGAKRLFGPFAWVNPIKTV